MDIVDVHDEYTVNGDIDQQQVILNSAVSTNNSSNQEAPTKVFNIIKKRDSRQFSKIKVIIN